MEIELRVAHNVLFGGFVVEVLSSEPDTDVSLS